jgi:hypothetical protein
MFISRDSPSAVVTYRLRRRLTTWGNGFGIRLTRAEARKLGLKAGDPVDVDVRGAAVGNDVASLPALHLGGRYDIDKIVEEESDAGA